jgi:HAD superfamily hydrolase (TIGR01549 family)
MKDFIFNVDGVLLDSTTMSINALVKAVRRCGVESPPFRMIKELWGHDFENFLIPTLADTLKWPLAKDREVIERFYEISYAQKYPSQLGLANELRKMSLRCKLGIISNRDMDSLLRRLAEQDIDVSIFTHIHTPEKGVRKPDSKVFNHFWNGAGFKPENTLFVGDSIEHDLAAARSHTPPICFAGITSGLHSTGEFLKSGVKLTHIFKNLADVFQARYLIA